MVKEHILEFKKPSGTSRGVLTTKPSWILSHQNDQHTIYGEVSIIKSLNPEWNDRFPSMVDHVFEKWKNGETRANDYPEFPSLRMGLEMLELGAQFDTPFTYFDNDFNRGNKPIPINGLVWMGSKEDMRRQIITKIDQGFDCVKMKIGAIQFEEEFELLRYIRKEFGQSIELRVDANGAFNAENALQILDRLAKLKIHSIEQPIKQGKWENMASLCRETPLPIALDEELIGVWKIQDKKALLATIQPQYIILKPSLLGGFKASDEWIEIAESNQIGWWVTSALESNIGLNAIAQYTATKNNPMPQGLGTGQLYTNNFESPLTITNGHIHYDVQKKWNILT